MKRKNKFFKRISKKLFKRISLVLTVIISCFMLCIPVSAENLSLAVNINKPRADEYSGYIEYLINNNGVIYPRVTFWHFSLGGPTSDDYAFPEVRVTVSENRVVLNALFNDADPDQYHMYNWVVGNVNGVDGGSGSQYASYNCENVGIINAFWDTSCQIMGYKIYGNGVSWDCTLDSGSYNWSVMYSETSVLYDAILSMAEASVGNSGSITQNATENAENIQQNQDENTDKIIQNQEENTDKIINGGTDYNDVDGSYVNDYTNADTELNNSIKGSKENTTSFFNNFGNVLINTKIQRGLLFVSALFKEFFAINWLSNILTFGLSLGSFSFIIGATMLVVNSRKK